MRRSSRVAFAVSWAVFAVAVVLAWRKVLGGTGNVNGLLVATVAGFLGLGVLGAWLSDYESRDR